MSFECMREGFLAVLAPMRGTPLYGHIPGIPDRKYRRPVGLKTSNAARRRPIVEVPAGVFRPAVYCHVDVFQQNVLHGLILLAVNANTILAAALDVSETDVLQCADFAVKHPRPSCDGNGFTPAPPARGMMLGCHFDVAELDVFDIAGLAMSNRRAPPAGDNLAAFEQDLRNVTESLRADLQAAVARTDNAILDMYVPTRSVILALLTGLYDDGVVRADDIAFPNLNIAAVVRIDTVAVRNIQIVPNLETVD